MDGWLDVVKLLLTIVVIFGLIIGMQNWFLPKIGLKLD
jgi:hypothetical protein